MSKKKKVVLIGWDAGDWKVIDRLIGMGLMPTMKKFLEDGVKGRLATLDPPLSPMLWTSIATGVRPYKHGILGFVEPASTSGGVRPVSSKSRKVKAVWNMFTNAGIKSNIVGWWPSNPVEPIDGAMVSNLFQVERKDGETIKLEDWNMPEGTVHPKRLEETLKELRVHPSEITGNLVMPFVPAALELDKKADKRLLVITKYLAHATSLHAATTELMENEEWDFTAVYHDAIDHFSHAFMKYYPPKLDWIPQEEFDLFKDAVVGAYIYHDMMLDKMLKLCDDDTTVIICSDHGFHSDHLRPRFVPNVPSGPAVEHAPYGIFAAKGPGIKKGAQIFGSSILDITPTLLTLYGLPVGKDMDGKVLTDIFEKAPKVSFIDTWEGLPGEFGELSGSEKDDPLADEAALQQLIDLGYIDAPDKDEKKEVTSKGVAIENNFYLAKSYINAGLYAEAIPILEGILEKVPYDYRYLIEMVNALIKTKSVAKATVLMDRLEEKELIATSYFNVLKAKISYLDNKPAESIRLLKEALNEYTASPIINVELGKIFITVRDSENAKLCFNRAIEKDKENAHAFHGLGLTYLRDGDYEMAIDNFLQAIELMYHYPYAHLHLGESLMMMGEYEHAETAFQQVAIMLPGIRKTYKWLLEIQKILGNKEKLKDYEAICSEFMKGKVNIVSGLYSDNLNNFLDQLKEKGIDVMNTENIFNFNQNSISEENLNKNLNRTIFVPITHLGSLPLNFEYSILFVESPVLKSVEYLTKIDENKVFDDIIYDTGKINHIQKQNDVIEIWLDQQPDLDIVRITENNKKFTENWIKKLSEN